jgi:hypothetical protein
LVKVSDSNSDDDRSTDFNFGLKAFSKKFKSHLADLLVNFAAVNAFVIAADGNDLLAKICAIA